MALACCCRPAGFSRRRQPESESQPAALGHAAAGATLNVLAASVEVAVGGAAFAAARDGMTLGPGDQVRTSGGGVGLLTFFDGSELQLTPDSQVQINQANSTAGPTISVSQVLGTTVDRVQRLTAKPTNFSTDTPAATAVVRGTRYVVTVKCYDPASITDHTPAHVPTSLVRR